MFDRKTYKKGLIFSGDGSRSEYDSELELEMPAAASYRMRPIIAGSWWSNDPECCDMSW